MTKLIAPESAKEDVHSEFMQNFNGQDGWEEQDAPTNENEQENGSLKNDNEKEGKKMTVETKKTGKGKIKKSLTVEEISKYAKRIVKKHSDGELEDNSIKLSEVCTMAHCDKTLAKEIIYVASEIAGIFIKRIDDRLASSTPNPHVNAQKSLIIPASTMGGIKDDNDNLLFPVGTQFTMKYDTNQIILKRVA